MKQHQPSVLARLYSYLLQDYPDKEGPLAYLLEQDTRTVQKDGIHFKNGCDIDDQGLLQHSIGRQTTIFSDHHHTAEIVVRFTRPDGTERRCQARQWTGCGAYP